jgi:shikimate dehydrogenase
MKKVIGLIGYPLSHSFSNRYFTEKFQKEGLTDFSHEVFPLEQISGFSHLVQSRSDLIGLNVTIPYKESILPLMDELDSSAAAVGAVNTIKIVRTQAEATPKLIGFNTDVFGFANALKPFLKNNHQRALILGTGGSAKAVAYVLKQLGIDYFFVSRNKAQTSLEKNATVFTYSELNENHFNSCHLLVNCSPVGMSPKVQDFPSLPYSFIGPQHLLFDLIYNPDETLFLRKGKEQGALTQNGLTMLYLQAEASWGIWNS